MGSVLARIDQMMSSQGDGTGTIEQALDGKSISGATTASPTVVTCTGHGRAVGDLVFIDGGTGITEYNGIMRVLTASDANTLTLEDLDGNAIGSAGTFGGTVDLNPVFNIEPGAGETYDIVRINVAAGDTSALVVGGVLGLAALTNGIILAIYRGSTLRKTLTPTPIKGWHDWAMLAGSDISTTSEAVGGKFEVAVRATFAKTEDPVRLEGAEGDIMVMYTQDDLAGLVFLQAAVQGSNNVQSAGAVIVPIDSNPLT